MRIRALCAALLVSSPAFAGHVTTIQPYPSSVASCDRFDIAFALNRTYANPYDPQTVAVDALIAESGGPTVEFPCFYFVPVNMADMTENAAGAAWKLRYAFRQQGTYTVKLRVRDGGVDTITDVGSVTVTARTGKGFISVDSIDHQILRYDDGTPYHAIGIDLCWNNGGESGTRISDYRRWLTQFGTNHLRWMRYWLTDFACQAIEWSTSHWSGWYSGLGVYSQRASAMLDSTLSLCAVNGVYMQLVLQHHGQFSTTTDAEWSGNPYNTANGGPLASAGLFFADTGAQAQAKKQYRYIVARWAWSPNLFAWELFNEVNFTDGTWPAITAWHQQIASYVKSTDAMHHIVTTSATEDDLLREFDTAASALDILQYHTYARNIQTVVTEHSTSLLGMLHHPILCGEFGNSGVDLNNHPDHWGDHFRRTSWFGMLRKVYAEYWTWLHVEKDSLWGVLKPLADYSAGLEPSGLATAHPVFHGGPLAAQLSFTGGLGWATSTQQEFTVDSTGAAAGLGGLSTYLQGTWHTNMGNWTRWHVDFGQAGQAGLDVSDISTSGTNSVVILVDNVPVDTNAFTAAGSFNVNVSAGQHTIEFRNVGQDWVDVTDYHFGGMAISALDGLMLASTRAAYGYCYDTRNGEWIDPALAQTVSGAALDLSGMDDGTYHVTFVNPRTGDVATAADATAQSGAVHVPLPDFIKDWAFKVVNSGPSTVASAVRPPRSAGVSVVRAGRVLLVSSKDGLREVRLFDGLGRLVWRCGQSRGRVSVPLAPNAAGAYILRVTTATGVSVSRVSIGY